MTYLIRMISMKHLCCLILILSFSCGIQAAEPFRHYNVIDGLSGSEITSVCENENFLWIATTDGLNRFDGHKFKVFKRDATSENSLTENSIETLMFDSRGLLWIGLKTGGVDIYDPRKDKFTSIGSLVSGALPDRVMYIFEDSEQNIWLGSWGEGLFKLSLKNSKTLSFSSEQYFNGYIVSAITEMPSGSIWVGTYTGYYIYSLKKDRWENVSSKELVITSFLQTGEKNRLWCSTWGKGLVEFNWEGHLPENVKENYLYVDDIYAIYRLAGNKNHTMYLGTWGEGLMTLDCRLPASIRSMREGPFSSPLIYALYEDKNGKLWIGTYGDGLYCYDPSEKGIAFVPASGAKKIPASVGNIVSIDENLFLAGTLGGGFYLFDLKKNELIRKYYAPPGQTYENNTLALYIDKEIVIAGHDGGGLLYSSIQDICKPSAGFKRFYEPHLDKVTSIFKGEKDRIWLGTKQDGLMSVRYNPDKKVLENFVNHQSFSSGEITGFAAQDSYLLWIASHSGLFLFDTENNTIRKDRGVITNKMVYCIEKDNKNNCLWIGTSTGISRMDLDGTYQLTQPFSNELVPRGTVKEMILDDDNNLWFIIAGRIFCYVEKESNVREINLSVLNSRPATSCAVMHTKGTSKLIFGSTNDFILIDPARILSENRETKVVFTELQIDHRTVSVGEKVYGQVVLDEETEYTSELLLSYRCKWISFVMAETNNDIWKTNFQYRISGFSDKWQYLDISYPITFSQLNPGDYVLQLRTFDGESDSPPCWTMHISVSYPWWNTGWFYFGLIVAGLALIVLVILFIRRYYKKRQLQRLAEIEKNKKEELLREKESFFAGLSHDLTTPFSLIIAPANDLLRDETTNDPTREKLEIIAKNASFLSDLFGTILDVKRAETSDSELNEKQIEVVSFVRMIVNAFDYLADSKSIAFSFRSNIHSLSIVIDSVKLERVIYNLLSNAIKFTPDNGEVSVGVDYFENGALNLSIKDNGPGIEERNQEKVFEKFYREAKYEQDNKSKGLGLGLYIVRQFVSLLGGEVLVDSMQGEGTSITICLTPEVIRQAITDADIQEVRTTDKEEERTTILLVEDNDELRNYLQKRLSEQFRVISAADGVEALHLIRENLPEIVISDIMMSEMDGLTLTKTIKDNPLYADIFMVLLTARSSAEDEQKGYKAGADIYLKKPFDS